MSALQNKHLFVAVIFVSTTLVLALQLINPSPVVVSVGEGGANTATLGDYFRYRSVGIITVAAVLMGASGMYLLLAEIPDDSGTPETPRSPGSTTVDEASITPSEKLLESRRQEWEETAGRLANKEQKVYEIVLESDGVCAQSDIVDKTDLSKASVSRALDW